MTMVYELKPAKYGHFNILLNDKVVAKVYRGIPGVWLAAGLEDGVICSGASPHDCYHNLVESEWFG